MQNLGLKNLFVIHHAVTGSQKLDFKNQITMLNILLKNKLQYKYYNRRKTVILLFLDSLNFWNNIFIKTSQSFAKKKKLVYQTLYKNLYSVCYRVYSCYPYQYRHFNTFSEN